MGDAYDPVRYDAMRDEWFAKREKLRSAMKAKYPDLYAWVMVELGEKP